METKAHPESAALEAKLLAEFEAFKAANAFFANSGTLAFCASVTTSDRTLPKTLWRDRFLRKDARTCDRIIALEILSRMISSMRSSSFISTDRLAISVT